MKIAILAPGSRGDVQPYLALGVGLQRAGHAVRFISHVNFNSLVTSYGLEFFPIEGDVQQIVESEAMRARIEGGNFLALLAQMAKEAQRGAGQLARAGLVACAGMDYLLAGMAGVFIGLAIAEKLHIPLIQAYLVPFTPTRQYPGALAPDLPEFLGDSLNRLTHYLTRQMIWQGFRSADNLARKEVLAIPQAPFFGAYNSQWTQDLPVLYGFSPAVIPPAADWPASTLVTGYWFLEAAEDWSPPTWLVDFLDAEPAPVYIGFGSMSNRDPGKIAALVLQALKRTGQRAILLSGWGGLQADDLPDTVLMIDSVPHAWLFPRVAAVVHHGGAGTTAAGLRAGVPAVIVPFFGDQPFWGRRLASLGVASAPIPRKKLTVERLTQAIEQAVKDGDMRRRAADLGVRIRREDGVSNAVEAIGGLQVKGFGD